MSESSLPNHLKDNTFNYVEPHGIEPCYLNFQSSASTRSAKVPKYFILFNIYIYSIFYIYF